MDVIMDSPTPHLLLEIINVDMKDLTKKENWTPELIHVHKTRMFMGFIFGTMFGWGISHLL